MNDDPRSETENTLEGRRPIESRNSNWAKSVTTFLSGKKVSPNTISAMSVFFSFIAGTLFLYTRFLPNHWLKALFFLLAALMILMRLLCNLFDGMVAIEGGMKSPSGEVFNDFPDRLSDALIIVGAGYSCVGFEYAYILGWIAAQTAFLTAYARVLGHSCGAKHYFSGPMAKQHRMALIIAASLASGIELLATKTTFSMAAALTLLILGGLITIVRRLKFIVGELEND